MITIKKYPNRRLYDTSKSQYINLDAVKAMVKQQTPFQVLDSKTGNDITRQILLQIITEHETKSQQAILSRNLLQELVRQYGTSRQVDIRWRLERGLEDFLNDPAPAVDEPRESAQVMRIAPAEAPSHRMAPLAMGEEMAASSPAKDEQMS